MSRTILTDRLESMLSRILSSLKELDEEARIPAGATVGWAREISAGANTDPNVPFPAPRGWLVCDGTAVSRFIYARVFAEIGTDFGVGDGVNTFNLPDYGSTLNGERHYVLIKT